MKMVGVISIALVLVASIALGVLNTYNNQSTTAPPPTIWEDGPHCGPNGHLYERSTRTLKNGLIIYRESIVWDDARLPVPCND